MTVALVYNLKLEAAPVSDRATNPPQQDSHSLHVVSRNSHVSPLASVERTNDMYAEWDTPETVNAVRAALEERHNVVMIEADTRAFQRLLETRPDFVFNMAEGLHGSSREAQIPAILEMLQIPYLGSDPLTLAVCLDKARAKEILVYHGVPTAPFTVVRNLDELDDARVRFPAMVKPLHEGSSKGIYDSCLVKDTVELEQEVRKIIDTYNEPALVEEYLSGREFTVGMLGNGDTVRVLPIVEIKFDALPPGVNPIYSYEAKWIWDTTDEPLNIFDCPAHLDPKLKDEIERICKDAYRVLNCRDWSRIDVRLDAAGRPHILEINPLPGILPKPEDNSCLPKAARAAGMSYNELINTVLDIAMARCGVGEPVAMETAIRHRREPAAV